jgi:hypothetical protein
MANEPTPLPSSNTRNVVIYNIALSVVMSFGLYQVVVRAAERDIAYQKESLQRTEVKVTKTLTVKADSLLGQAVGSRNADTVAPLDSVVTITEADPASTNADGERSKLPNLRMVTYVMWAVLLAGGLGGTLSNLRGIFEYYRDYTFIPDYLELPFYIRPISGMICGLFTFFLARFFTIALSSGENISSWQTLEGMLPYIGVALLAGFASQEFMERMRETARTFFGTNAAPAATETTVIQMQSGEGSGVAPESISTKGGTRSRGAGGGGSEEGGDSKPVVVVQSPRRIKRGD